MTADPQEAMARLVAGLLMVADASERLDLPDQAAAIRDDIFNALAESTADQVETIIAHAEIISGVDAANYV